MYLWVQDLKSFRDSGKNNHHKACGMGLLLLVATDRLAKDEEQLRVINHRVKAKCESAGVLESL